MSGKFLYFAYGSNLLRERLQLLNPSAVFKQVVKLENYKLVFGFSSLRWKGHVASIKESFGHTVWGVMYELNHSDLENLDRQEGVKKEIYKPIYVQVKDNFNNLYQCRTYQLISQNTGLPSPKYKDIMIRGAKQHQLPSEYIKTLTVMCDNGSTEEIPIYNELMEIIGEKTSS